MNKFMIIVIFLLVFMISACGITFSQNTNENNHVSENKPPDTDIEVDHKQYDTILGAYCWDYRTSNDNREDECVDVAGPVELLADEEPIAVNPGEHMTLIIDDERKPDDVQLSQMKNDEETDIEIDDNQLTAPEEKGIYYYDYDVSWVADGDQSHGDVSYAFVIEVK